MPWHVDPCKSSWAFHNGTSTTRNTPKKLRSACNTRFLSAGPHKLTAAKTATPSPNCSGRRRRRKTATAADTTKASLVAGISPYPHSIAVVCDARIHVNPPQTSRTAAGNTTPFAQVANCPRAAARTQQASGDQHQWVFHARRKRPRGRPGRSAVHPERHPTTSTSRTRSSDFRPDGRRQADHGTPWQ